MNPRTSTIPATLINSYTLRNSALKIVDSNAVMYGFNQIENVTGYNMHIPNKVVGNPNATPVILPDDNIGAIVSTITAVDTINMTISAPMLYTDSGADGATVPLEFYYRKTYDTTYNGKVRDYSNPGWTRYTPNVITTNWDTLYTKGPTKSTFTLPVTLSLPSIDYYDIKVVRSPSCPENPADITVVNIVYLQDVSEISYDELIYPCTALLGARIKATNQLSGSMPTITSIVRGIKVQVPSGYVSTFDNTRYCGLRYQGSPWDGTLATTPVWTDNPVWCLYDLLTNTRYGLGNDFYIAPGKEGVMLANFFTMAQYCDEYLLQNGDVVSPRELSTQVTVGTFASINRDGYLYQCIDPGTTSSGTLTGNATLNSTVVDGTVVWKNVGSDTSKPRFSLNIVLDQQKSAREWINTICASMRATLFNCEGIVFLDIDRPKSMTQLFNVSNITNYTQSCASFKSIPNIYFVQFPNMEKDYQTESFTLETAEYQSDITQPQVALNLNLIGITNDADARKLTSYTLAKVNAALTTISFKTGTDLLLASVLDVIGVQHDVPMWGSGGKVTAVSTDGATLTLSSSFDYSPTDNGSGSLFGSLSVAISQNGQPPVTLQIAEPTSTGTFNTITVVSQAGFTPAIGDVYIVNFTTNTVKPFLIAAIQRDSEEFVQVTCIEYNDQIYSGDITQLGSITNTNYSTLPVPTKKSVNSFSTSIYTGVDGLGRPTVGVDIWYSVPSSINWKGLQVAYQQVGASSYLYTTVDTTGHIQIPSLSEGTYQFIGISLWKDGSSQTISECLSDAINKPYATLPVAATVPNSYFTNSSVTGLEAVGYYDGTFIGKDCKLEWRPVVVSDQSLNSTATNSSAGSSQADLTSYYIITVSNMDGTIRRTDKTTTETYTYTHEFNAQDGTVARFFKVTVVAVDVNGNQNKPSILTCSNPAPQALT